MRNKNTIYIMIGIAFIIVLSVGYALFSETISIQGTARAEGNFNITYSCASGLDYFNTKKPTIAALDDNDRGYTSDICTPDNAKDEVALSVALNYPGATRWFRITAENTGDIDALIGEKMSTITEHTLCLDGNGGDRDGVINQNTECHDARSSQAGDWLEFVEALQLFKENSINFAFEDASGTVYTMQDLMNMTESDPFIVEHADETTGNIAFKPREKIHLYIKAELSSVLEGDSILSNDHITIKAPFNQRTGY